MVQYFATDPNYLRGLAKAEVTFLARKADRLYGWQAAEREVAPARLWKAPVEVTADKSANFLTSQEASAAIANPGTQTVTVKGTLYDQYGVAITSHDFIVPPQGAIGLVFSNDQAFGQAMFPQNSDFSGWVAFEVTSPTGGAVTVLVLQVVGDSMSNVDVQAFP
jgi:hypothetical protein